MAIICALVCAVTPCSPEHLRRKILFLAVETLHLWDSGTLGAQHCRGRLRREEMASCLWRGTHSEHLRPQRHVVWGDSWEGGNVEHFTL